jgi:hypothetical protein
MEFLIGDIVYIMNERCTVIDGFHLPGIGWVYYVEHSTKPFWGTAQWHERLLVSESDWQARQEQKTEAQPTDAQLRQERLDHVQQMRDNGMWWFGRQGIPWD